MSCAIIAWHIGFIEKTTEKEARWYVYKDVTYWIESILGTLINQLLCHLPLITQVLHGGTEFANKKDLHISLSVALCCEPWIQERRSPIQNIYSTNKICKEDPACQLGR